MKQTIKRWIATVHYSCERLGEIDVDFCVDDLASVHELIETGPGYSAVKFIEVHRNPTHPDSIVTIEELAGTASPAETREIKLQKDCEGGPNEHS